MYFAVKYKHHCLPTNEWQYHLISLIGLSVQWIISFKAYCEIQISSQNLTYVRFSRTNFIVCVFLSFVFGFYHGDGFTLSLRTPSRVNIAHYKSLLLLFICYKAKAQSQRISEAKIITGQNHSRMMRLRTIICTQAIVTIISSFLCSISLFQIFPESSD